MLRQRGQLFSLVFVDQGLDDGVQVSLHETFQLVQGEVDTVIGDAPLGKVIGANAFRAVAAAHQGFAGLGLFLLLFFLFRIHQARLQ